MMELCERGELSMLIRNRGTLSEDEARIVMHRLISAIAYLHKQGQFIEKGQLKLKVSSAYVIL